MYNWCQKYSKILRIVTFNCYRYRPIPLSTAAPKYPHWALFCKKLPWENFRMNFPRSEFSKYVLQSGRIFFRANLHRTAWYYFFGDFPTTAVMRRLADLRNPTHVNSMWTNIIFWIWKNRDLGYHTSQLLPNANSEACLPFKALQPWSVNSLAIIWWNIMALLYRQEEIPLLDLHCLTTGDTFSWDKHFFRRSLVNSVIFGTYHWDC